MSGDQANRAALKRMWVGVALASIGQGLTLPYLLVYLHQVRGLSTGMSGVVIAYMAALGLFATPAFGWAVDHFGPGRVMTLGLVGESISVLLLTQIRSVTSAFVVATIMAVGQSGVWPPQTALLARISPEGKRQRVFAFQFLLLNLGLGIGGLIASVIIDVHRPITFTHLYFVNFLAYAGYTAVSVTLWRVGGPAPQPAAHDGVGGYREVGSDRVLRRLVPAMLLILICGYGQLEVGFTAYATTVLHVSAAWLGIAWSANTFTIVAAQWGMLRLVRGRSRSSVMVWSGLLWALCWVLVGVAGWLPSGAAEPIALLLALGVFGLGETLWSPTVPALLNDLAPEHLRGRYNAVLATNWTMAATLGPLLSGLLIGGGLGTWWVWGIAAGCLVGSLAVGGVRHLLTPAQDGRGVDVAVP